MAQQGPSGPRIPPQLVVAALSAFGVASISLFVIGRLWTIAYFRHFGLPARDLDFSIEDFAFRSLEVLISLLIATLALTLAWWPGGLGDWLRRQGNYGVGVSAFVLSAAASITAIWVLRTEWFQEFISNTLDYPGLLGMANGVTLGFWIFGTADVWKRGRSRWIQQPGTGGKPSKSTIWDWLLFLVSRFASPIRWAIGMVRQNRGPGDSGPSWIRSAIQRIGQNNKLVGGFYQVSAVITGLAIAFLYLPAVSDRLADVRAALDLEMGQLPAAFLESNQPLPGGLASDVDPMRSVAVRVILTSGENTFVLNSTNCTTIAEAGASIEETDEGRVLADEDTDVCNVFAIPTDQLTSIEYFQVDGRKPSNDSFALAEEVSLEDEFVKTVSTRFADRQPISCNSKASSAEEDSREHQLLWYRFAAPADGTVKATVAVLQKSSKVDHSVGIWEDQPDGPPKVLLGSHDGLACLNESAAGMQRKGEREIAVIANVQPGGNYFVSLGSERGGDATLTLEFNPRARYFNRSPGAGGAAVLDGVGSGESEPHDEPSPDAGSMEVLVEADRATVTVQLTALNAKTFKEEPLSEDIELTLTAAAPEEDGPACLRPDGFPCPVRDGDGVWIATNVRAGTWIVTVARTDDEAFVGHARVTVTNSQAVVIALNDAVGVDRELQRALFLLANSATEGFEGEPASVDSESFVQTALVSDSGEEPAAGESAQTEIQEIIEGAKLPQDFDVQIQIEAEEQALAELAAALAEEINQAGLEARVSDCQGDADVCFRIFRRAGAAA